jgi:hypothetical protein
VSDTWDDEDRAIARALDAVPDVDGDVDVDVDTQGAERALVDSYREVLAELPVAEIAPRPELEARVVSAAIDRRRATVASIGSRRDHRFSRVRLAALTAAAVAAAVVIGLIVSSGSTSSTTPGGSVSLATQQHADVDALARSPGAYTGEFGNGHGRVVIAADGRSAVYDLASDDPVVISLSSAGGTTTLGPARPVGRIVTFSVDHPGRVTSVALVRNGAEIARASLKAN